MTSRSRWYRSAAYLVGFASLPVAAHAAPPKPAASATTSSDEIIVTAEKRETTLQRAPIAISAIGGEKLRETRVVQLSDLNGYVPGLTIAKNAGFTRVATIRGIGYETSETVISQPGVAFHQDGVYIVSPYTLQMDLLDLQRMEVLRGPQSTIFGQGATGGTINAITAKPVLGEFSGHASVSLGNYHLEQAEGAINIPLGETLALRIAAQRYKHDGFAQQTDIPGYGLDDANHYSARAALLWKPSDRFTATLTGEHFYAHEHGSAQKNVLDPNPDPRLLSQDYPNNYKLDVWLGYLDARYDFDTFTVKSLTSYQHTRNDNGIDNDRFDQAGLAANALPYRYDHIPNWDNTAKGFSQEFDLTSKAGGKLDYIIGAYYLYAAFTQDLAEFVGSDANPVYYLPPDLPNNFPANLDYTLSSQQSRRTFAGFGQLVYHLGNSVRLTAGARYTNDTVESAILTDAGLFGPVFYTNPKSSAVTGKVQVDVDVTPTNLVYASVSRGYKPGGASAISYSLLVSPTFAPETLWAYEVGSKNQFFGRKLTVNASAFFYDYKNLQYQEEDPIFYAGGVANIPKTHIWGAEMETKLNVSKNLTLEANGTWLGGKFVGHYDTLDAPAAYQAYLAAAALGYGAFDDYTIAARAAQVRNIEGNKPPKLPSFAGGAAFTYTADVGPGQATLHGEVQYRSSYYYRIFNDPVLDKVPSYTLVNLRAAFRPSGSPIEFSVTATNLFDVVAVNSRYTNPYGRFTTSNEYVAPRQVIGTVSYRF